ncbi:Transmembrane channel-like protein 6 [Merluccius polli]|uniref:Transmembrane channel-like protein n=1 Tax=Merluccius polli TaxID=89951 RepID=A0AA47MCH8_MERPO|nr:Transmembrane channel-like protein 6 [Merluccius polli]
MNPVPLELEELGKHRENVRMQLVSNLRRLPVGERVCTLKAMPLNLAQKIELRKLAGDVNSNSLIDRESPCYSILYVNIVRTWRLLLSGLAFLGSLRLWQTQLKLLGGRFGTPVLSYFLFLRTLLLFNILLLLVNGMFLVFPQALDPPAYNSSLHTYSGLHLLTGEGYVLHSVMFYGYYGNTLPGQSCGPAEPEPKVSSAHDIAYQSVCDGVGGPQMAPVAYNIPLSYFFAIVTGLFITCIILVCRFEKSFGRSFRVFPSRGKLAETVFCCWDFKVTKKLSVQRQSENISVQLKEQLSEQMCCERGHSFVQRLRLQRVRLLAWAVCLASVFLSGCATYFLADHMHVIGLDDTLYLPIYYQFSQWIDSQHFKAIGIFCLYLTHMLPDQRLMANVEVDVLRESHLLVLPAVVSSINLLLPGLFHLISRVERYDSPLVATYVSIFRNLLLKVSVLGTLCYHWLWRIASEPESYSLQCWENFVGQELYRLILMDFFCTIINTFTGEFLWRLFSNGVLKRGRRPVFDISWHAVELIYGQTLTWLGVFFAPLLPVVQLIKLLLLFYIKKSDFELRGAQEALESKSHDDRLHGSPVLPFIPRCCNVRHLHHLDVSRSIGSYRSLCLEVSLVIVRPSSACGPFRNTTTPLEAQKLLWQMVDTSTNPKLFWFSHLVENPLFLFLAAGVFLIVIFTQAHICAGQRRVISLLEQQIVKQGYEKQFLINKLQAIHEVENEESVVL